VRQYLFYIGRAKLTMADCIREEGLDYQYHIIDMHNVSYDSLMAQNTPDALVLAILSDFGEHSDREAVRRIVQALYELTGDDVKSFRDYFLMLEVLSSNRELRNILQEEEEMFSQVRQQDLASYGLGMKQGLMEGKAEGKLEGKLEGEALMLLSLLEQRFGSVPDDLRSRILLADSDTLLLWSGRIFSADSIEGVFF